MVEATNQTKKDMDTYIEYIKKSIDNINDFLDSHEFETYDSKLNYRTYCSNQITGAINGFFFTGLIDSETFEQLNDILRDKLMFRDLSHNNCDDFQK